MGLVHGEDSDDRDGDPSASSSSSLSGARANGSSRKVLTARDAFGDSSSDEEEHDGRASRHETLSGFSRSKSGQWAASSSSHAARASSREKPKVIESRENNNWWEERRKRMGVNVEALAGHGPDRRTHGAAAATKDRMNDEAQKVGLEVRRGKREDAADGAREGEVPPMEVDADNTAEKDPKEEGGDLDEEAQARAALLSGSDPSSAARKSSTVIALTEEEALRHDASTRPDAPTLESYAKMPVEDFGAAILRGMGWKEGMGAGKKRDGPTRAPQVQKRAALLGLGAKERDLDKANNGGGANGARANVKARPERRYVPVIKREQPEQRDSPRSRRSSLSPSGRDSDRDRDRDRARNRDHDRDRGRDRDHDRDRDRDRSRYYDDRKRHRDDGDRDRERDRENHRRHRDRDHDKDAYRETDRRHRDDYGKESDDRRRSRHPDSPDQRRRD